MSKREKIQLAQALLAKRQRQAGGLDLLTWTILHRPYLKEGLAFNLTNHLYLAEMYQLSAQHKVIKKAAQMGVSELGVSHAIWSADTRQATVLYVFPTDTHVSDFSSARIGPAIEASDYLSQIVVSASSVTGKRGADRVGLKRIRDRFLYLRGAKVGTDGSAPQLKSIDADVVILDELDEMDSRVPQIAEKRLGHSMLKEQIKISTPSYTGRGIDAEYLASDQRRWMLKCSNCNEWQYLDINHVVVEWDDLKRPIRWHGQKENRAYCACQKCGRELNRLDYGSWVAEHPGRETVGYHLTKLFSPLANLLPIVQTLQNLDETTRKECWNQDLGEPYTPTGGQLTDTELDACLRQYALGVGKEAEKTVMGVDVGSLLHVVIRGPLNQDGERPLRLAIEVESFDEVARLIKQYKVGTAVIDALPETRKARELQASFRDGLVWLAYYNLSDKHPDPADWNKRDGNVTLHRTRLLDATFARFREQENSLPANGRGIANYYSHLKAPTRVIENGVALYIEQGADHYAHAESYCTAASLRQRSFLW